MAERLSRIPFRSSLRTPDAMRCRSDCTDVSRSSHIVTGREVSACIRSPKALARTAAGPSSPLKRRGRPSTTDVTPISAARRARTAMSFLSPSLRIGGSGCAVNPRGSDTATPIRRLP